jgi:hypothetical protein
MREWNAKEMKEHRRQKGEKKKMYRIGTDQFTRVILLCKKTESRRPT